MIFELVKDLHDVLDGMPERHPRRRTLKLLDEAVRRDAYFIDRRPTTLFQCLWNACWWYDCPESAEHDRAFEGGAGPAKIPDSVQESCLHRLLETWRRKRQSAIPGSYWVRNHRPPMVRLGGALAATFKGHGGRVAGFALSSDGNVIAAADGDEFIRLWDVDSGIQLARLAAKLHHERRHPLAFSPDGDRIAYIDDASNAVVCDSRTGNPLIRLEPPDMQAVHGAIVTPDGASVITASADRNIRIWDAQTGDELLRFHCHEKDVTSIAVSPDGRLLLTGSWDETARIWDVATGAELVRFTGQGVVNGAAFLPDGRAVTSGDDGTVRIWESLTGAEQARFGESGQRANRIAPSSDGERLAVCSGKSLRIFNVSDGSLAFSFDDLDTEFHCLPFWYVSVTYSSDGRFIAAGTDQNVVRLWDAQRGLLVRRIDIGPRCNRGVHALAFSPKGDELAVGFESDVMIWNIETGECRHRFRAHERDVRIVGYSPDGQKIISAGDDKRARLWNRSDAGELTWTNFGDGLYWDRQTSIAYSPDGSWIATGSEAHVVRLWDAGAGRQVWRVSMPTKGSVSLGFDNAIVKFSPDGRRLAAGGTDGIIRIWDAATGVEELLIEAHGGYDQSGVGVRDLCFAPDGERLVSVGGKNEIRIWSASTGAEILAIDDLGNHPDRTNHVAFSPDGRHVAAAGRRVSIIDSHRGDEFRCLAADCVWPPAFSKDGRYLFTSSGADSIRMWDLTVADPDIQARVSERLWRVQRVRFSAAGRRLVTASGKPIDAGMTRGEVGAARIWNVENGTELATVRDLPVVIGDVAFAERSERLAVSQEGAVLIMDVPTGREVLRLAENWTIVSLAFSPDEERLVALTEGGTVTCWSATTGRKRFTVQAPFEKVWADKRHIGFTPDGGSLVAYSERGGKVCLWDAASGRLRTVFPSHYQLLPSVRVAVSAGGRIAGTADYGRICLWAEWGAVEWPALQVDERALCLAFAPDGERLASGHESGVIRIWDVSERNKLRQLAVIRSPNPEAVRAHAYTVSAKRGDVLSVAFSPDGSRLISGCADGMIRSWDVQKAVGSEDDTDRSKERRSSSTWIVRLAGAFRSLGRRKRSPAAIDASHLARALEFQGHRYAVNAVAVSPTEPLFASGGGRGHSTSPGENLVRIWDLRTGAPMRAHQGERDGVACVTFSPDGRRLATGSYRDGLIRVHDVLSGAERLRISAEQFGLHDIAFSPDGTRLASAAYDAPIRIWDLEGGAESMCLPGHLGGAETIAFDPEGRRLISGGQDDGTVRVWDLRSGMCVRVLRVVGPVAQVVHGLEQFPWRAERGRSETTIRSVLHGCEACWFPETPDLLTVSPSGRTWTGAVGSYTFLCTLEGSGSDDI